MQGLKARAADIGRARGREIEQRIGRELRLARATVGYRQEDVARRSGVSQSVVSAVELGRAHPSIDVLARVAAACGHELAFRVFPVAGASFRDTPQLLIAQLVVAQAHPVWHASTEVPVGDAHGRAADLVLMHPEEVLHMEIESGLVDLQAQVRPAQVKRDWLARRFDRPVRLVIVLNDTHLVRQRLAPHAEFVRRVLPASSRDVWRAVRHGTPLGGDGILFARTYRGSPATRAAGTSERVATPTSDVTRVTGASRRENVERC